MPTISSTLKRYLASMLVIVLLGVAGYALVFSIAFVVMDIPLLFPVGAVIISCWAGVAYAKQLNLSKSAAIMGGAIVGGLANILWLLPAPSFWGERAIFWGGLMLVGGVSAYFTVLKQAGKVA